MTAPRKTYLLTSKTFLRPASSKEFHRNTKESRSSKEFVTSASQELKSTSKEILSLANEELLQVKRRLSSISFKNFKKPRYENLTMLDVIEPLNQEIDQAEFGTIPSIERHSNDYDDNESILETVILRSSSSVFSMSLNSYIPSSRPPPTPRYPCGSQLLQFKKLPPLPTSVFPKGNLYQRLRLKVSQILNT